MPVYLIAMGADHSFYVKTIEIHARAFLPLNISAIGTVVCVQLVYKDFFVRAHIFP